MTDVKPTLIEAGASRRFLPALLVLFAASGCSALIYEIVWYQLLQLVIGSTAISLGVLLATFMGGLCLGSVLLPRFLLPGAGNSQKQASRHPLRIFAFVELGIALCGILVLVGMPLVSGVYVAAVGHGMPSILLRAVLCAVCLLAPTALMGASLPVAARWLERNTGVSPLRSASVEMTTSVAGVSPLHSTPVEMTTSVAGGKQNTGVSPLRSASVEMTTSGSGVSALRSAPVEMTTSVAGPGPTAVGAWLGLLYGSNTLGAVFGCLLAGFYLLREFDITTATLVAAAINVAVAGISLLLARRSKYEEPATTASLDSNEANEAGESGKAGESSGTVPYWPVYVGIALSGASALGAEVVWTRLLGLMLGATVYVFSLILAVFLAGMGAGSLAGSLVVRRALSPTMRPTIGPTVRARVALGWCQMGLALSVLWTAWILSSSLPFWPINPYLSTNVWYTFQLDLVRCIWAILPATLLWGASFPLALAAASRDNDSARTVGRVYATNTGGAILGALAFSMVLIPWIGTRYSESVLVGICVLSALVVLAPLLWRSRSVAGGVLLAATACGAIALAARVHDIPGELIAYGRAAALQKGQSEILYTAEGMNSSIAVSKWNDGAIQFHVSGKVEASTEPSDMRLQRMLGHLPALLHGQPRSALIVGFGAGVTAGSFVLHPSIQRIVICEMEPMIPQTTKKYFHAQHYDVLDDPRTRVIFDDARDYVLTTREKFDIITSDPIHPFVKGSAMLYSQEYFEMVKKHLNPGGVVTQWVPLYESDLDAVRSEIATFFAVFPEGAIFANEDNGGGYDLVMLGRNELNGQKSAMPIDVDALEDRLAQPAYARVAQSLSDVGINSTAQLLGTYAGQASDLEPWLRNAQINRDRNLRLQYLAGFALNEKQEGTIYNQMLEFRRYPDKLFTVSGQRQAAFLAAFQARGH